MDLVGVRGALCEDSAVQQHVDGLVHVEVDVVAGREVLIVVLERAVEEGVRERLLVASGPRAVEDPPPHVVGGHERPAALGIAVGHPPEAEVEARSQRRWPWRCGAEGGTSTAALRRKARSEASGTEEKRRRSGWWRAGAGGGIG